MGILYIQNGRDCSKFKDCSPLQLLCNLTGNRPQSATFHTAIRSMRAKTTTESEKSCDFFFVFKV